MGLQNFGERVRELKEERNAVILAHYFQRPEVRALADFVGSKSEMIKEAAASPADVVVICGVRFIAEVVVAQCPDKKVLLPDIRAECPMAAMVEPGQITNLKEKYPGAPVISYIKSTLGAKAESDHCLAPEGIVEKVAEFSGKEMIFIPDRYLGDYLQERTDKRVVSAEGYCPPHVKVLPSDVEALKGEHPDARVLASHQCRGDVRRMADFVGSSKEIVDFAGVSDSKEFIVAAEEGLARYLEDEFPWGTFHPASRWAVCRQHKLIDEEKVLWSLEDNIYEVKVPEELAEKARDVLAHLVIERPR